MDVAVLGAAIAISCLSTLQRYEPITRPSYIGSPQFWRFFLCVGISVQPLQNRFSSLTSAGSLPETALVSRLSLFHRSYTMHKIDFRIAFLTFLLDR